MKKLALICLCGLVAASIMTGCGASQTEGKENLGTVELAEYCLLYTSDAADD